MIAFLLDNIATIVISAVLFAVVVLITVNLVKRKKNGKGAGCGCGCEGCPSASLCHKH